MAILNIEVIKNGQLITTNDSFDFKVRAARKYAFNIGYIGAAVGTVTVSDEIGDLKEFQVFHLS